MSWYSIFSWFATIKQRVINKRVINKKQQKTENKKDIDGLLQLQQHQAITDEEKCDRGYQKNLSQKVEFSWYNIFSWFATIKQRVINKKQQKTENKKDIDDLFKLRQYQPIIDEEKCDREYQKNLSQKVQSVLYELRKISNADLTKAKKSSYQKIINKYITDNRILPYHKNLKDVGKFIVNKVQHLNKKKDLAVEMNKLTFNEELYSDYKNIYIDMWSAILLHHNNDAKLNKVDLADQCLKVRSNIDSKIEIYDNPRQDFKIEIDLADVSFEATSTSLRIADLSIEDVSFSANDMWYSSLFKGT